MIDRKIRLEINGAQQTVRTRADREGLPPLLVVQAGPGFPLLHEIGKFRKLLNFERDFLTCYWDQRGCGDAPKADAESVSMRQQVDDVIAILRWLKNETGRTAAVLGISLGATAALQAAEREPELFASFVAVSLDAQIAESDEFVASFLRAEAMRDSRLRARLAKLGEPPYLDPAGLQLRARLLADLGCIENGKRFNALLGETLLGLLGVYGPFGAVRALGNMNRVQRRMLPEVAALDLFASRIRVTVPVHCVFGENDPLVPPAIAERLTALMTAPGSTSVRVSNAGHMVHFDHPELVRSIVLRAAAAAEG